MSLSDEDEKGIFFMGSLERVHSSGSDKGVCVVGSSPIALSRGGSLGCLMPYIGRQVLRKATRQVCLL